MIFAILIVMIQAVLIIDVIRNGRPQYWIMALMFLPVASTVAYLVIEVYPRMRHHRTVRHAREQIIERIDPERDVKAARDALDLTKTVANRIRLGDALAGRERYSEALGHYRDAAGGGIPDTRLGEKIADTLFHLDRNGEALAMLDAMTPPGVASELDRIAFLRARILDDMGQADDAEPIYRDLVTRYPGDEVRCRLAALYLKAGRKGEARAVLSEVERRMRRMTRAQRAPDAKMYDWAMRELAALGR